MGAGARQVSVLGVCGAGGQGLSEHRRRVGPTALLTPAACRWLLPGKLASSGSQEQLVFVDDAQQSCFSKHPLRLRAHRTGWHPGAWFRRGGLVGPSCGVCKTLTLQPVLSAAGVIRLPICNRLCHFPTTPPSPLDSQRCGLRAHRHLVLRGRSRLGRGQGGLAPRASDPQPRTLPQHGHPHTPLTERSSVTSTRSSHPGGTHFPEGPFCPPRQAPSLHQEAPAL